MNEPEINQEAPLCKDFKYVRHQEVSHIKQLRGDDADTLIGLAFSGGGIRSATLNLGILQGFAKHHILQRFDYLSTVSGGGYIGAWFSSLLLRNGGMLEIQAQLKQSTEPNPPPTATVKAIQWLRGYSNYLTPRTGLFTADTLSAIAQWLANTLLNQMLLLALLVTLMMGVIHLSHSEIDGHVTAAASVDWEALTTIGTNVLAQPWGITGIALTLASLLAALYLSRFRYRHRNCGSWPLIVYGIGVIGMCLVAWQLPADIVQSIWQSSATPHSSSTLTPNLLVGLGVPCASMLISLLLILIMGLVSHRMQASTREWWHRIGGINLGVSMVWVALFGFALYLPFYLDQTLVHLSNTDKGLGGVAAWVFSFLTANLGKSKVSSGENEGKLMTLLGKLLPYIVIVLMLLVSGYLSYTLYRSVDSNLWFSLAVITLVVGSYCFDINIFSLHNFYRNRLGRCYLGATNPARKADSFTGFDPRDEVMMAALSTQRPLHIVNTALNISDGSELAWQQRMAASFMFSPFFCGFKLPTQDVWYRTSSYTGLGGPKLGSLIATSGAAASPNMGYHTNPVMGLIMTIFNARLGRWFGNPLHENLGNRWLDKLHLGKPFKNPPERKSPFWNLFYLIKELFTNTGLTSGYLYLSDGGHFENLGIYELVRRRCKLIVAIDGGEDGRYQFEDLGNAIRKCKVDFGISIDINIDELLPVQDCKYGSFKCGTSHFAIGTIDYLGDNKAENLGYLVYIKSSLTGDEPTDLINFKLQEPAFPHHSTIDQFFNESQFESYRRLGEHIADKTLRKLQHNGEISNLLWPQQG